MPPGEQDLERGRFEGRVLSELGTIGREVGALKCGLSEVRIQTEGLVTAMAVHEEAHKRLAKAIKDNGNGGGCPSNDNGKKGFWVYIPTAAIVTFGIALAEIARAFLQR